jgi:hypothetical protein
VHEFDAATGYMKCRLVDSDLNVLLPPQLVADCDSSVLSSSYRPILPEKMRRPAAAAKAAREQNKEHAAAAAAAGDSA